MSKIIDCITFYDNNFIFDFRYNVINEFVDKFIICENLFLITEIKKKTKILI